MDALNHFEKFGLPGLVIGALFFSLWLLVKELKTLHLLQIEERKQWIQAFNGNTEILRELSAEIKRP